MSQVPLAPPTPTGGPLDGWLYLLWRRLTQAGQILWGSITPGTSADVAAVVTDKTGTPGSLVFSGNPTLEGLNVTTAAFTSRGITDNATATAVTIDSSKNIGIGAAPELSFLLELSSSGAGGPGLAMKKTGVPVTDNSLFAFAGYGSNSSALAVGGTINFKASEGWSTTANGTYIQFRTVKATTTTLAESARIWDNGAFTAGGPSTAPALKVTPVASQARWIEVTGATSSTNPTIGVSGGNLACSAVFMPVQATTAGAPAYVLGGMYFDTTLNKLRIGGATAWETVTSV